MTEFEANFKQFVDQKGFYKCLQLTGVSNEVYREILGLLQKHAEYVPIEKEEDKEVFEVAGERVPTEENKDSARMSVSIPFGI